MESSFTGYAQMAILTLQLEYVSLLTYHKRHEDRLCFGTHTNCSASCSLQCWQMPLEKGTWGHSSVPLECYFHRLTCSSWLVLVEWLKYRRAPSNAWKGWLGEPNYLLTIPEERSHSINLVIMCGCPQGKHTRVQKAQQQVHWSIQYPPLRQ